MQARRSPSQVSKKAHPQVRQLMGLLERTCWQYNVIWLTFFARSSRLVVALTASHSASVRRCIRISRCCIHHSSAVTPSVCAFLMQRNAMLSFSLSAAEATGAAGSLSGSCSCCDCCCDCGCCCCSGCRGCRGRACLKETMLVFVESVLLSVDRGRLRERAFSVNPAWASAGSELDTGFGAARASGEG
jgi:hypothetical protein